MKQLKHPFFFPVVLLLILIGTALLVPETMQAADMPVSVSTCKLNHNGKKLTVKAKVKQKTSDMGKKLYLLALDANAAESGKVSAKPLTSLKTRKGTLTFTVKYNKTMLCQKFVIAAKSGNKYKIMSTVRYITNPEVLATYTGSGPKTLSKKGLQPEDLSEALDLRISHAVVNWTLSSLLTTDKKNGTPYKYRGKTYYFNPGVLLENDTQVKAYNAAKAKVTVILLLPNDFSPATAAMRFHCPESAQYSSVKTSTEKGCRTFEAVMTFLAERYGTKENLVSGWILGNEVNNPGTWNYNGGKSLGSYMKNYARNFRICYNAVKSVSKNAKVYISLDYNWNYDADQKGKQYFSTKSVLDRFYDTINSQGRIVFHIAYHAYPQGLRDPVFWDDSHAKNSVDTDFVTFRNLKVLTDYVKKNFGKQYTIMLSEQSFNSSKGELVQAAAYAYAYYMSEGNSMIESFIYGRQFDHPVETQDGLYWGLSSNQRQKRLIWDVFQYIDSKDSFKFTNPLLPYTNLSKWSKISGFKKSRYQNMPSARVKPSIAGISSNTATSVSLFWNRIPACDGYVVYRDNELIAHCPGNTTQGYTDTGLTPGKTYSYKLKMYKLAPSAEDPNQKTALYAPASSAKKITVTGSRPMWNQQECQVSGSQITLSWIAQEGVDGYELLRSESENGSYRTIAATDKTRYTDTGTTSGKTYYYKVRSFINTGTGTYRAPVSDPIAKEALIQLDAKIVSGDVLLNWSSWPGAVSYQIYVAKGSGNTFTRVKTVAELKYLCTQYKNTDGQKEDFRKGSSYRFRVRAVLSDGSRSPYSNVVEVAIPREAAAGKKTRNSDPKAFLSENT